eukprot:13464-Heterococcus_DN1.PRE.1
MQLSTVDTCICRLDEVVYTALMYSDHTVRKQQHRLCATLLSSTAQILASVLRRQHKSSLSSSYRTITFIPPDGEFELMRYRLIPAVQEEGRARVTINLKLSAQFSYKLFAENVVIKVPVPNNTARCKLKVGAGRAKYEPEQRAIVWRIKRFAGMTESTFSADVELTPSIREKAWSRPPIQVCIAMQCSVVSCCYCAIDVLKLVSKRCQVSCCMRLQPTSCLLCFAEWWACAANADKSIANCVELDVVSDRIAQYLLQQTRAIR